MGVSWTRKRKWRRSMTASCVDLRRRGCRHPRRRVDDRHLTEHVVIAERRDHVPVHGQVDRAADDPEHLVARVALAEHDVTRRVLPCRVPCCGTAH